MNNTKYPKEIKNNVQYDKLRKVEAVGGDPCSERFTAGEEYVEKSMFKVFTGLFKFGRAK